MATLSLTPNPTFSASVLIPIPGADPVPVQFTFRHRNRQELKDWLSKEREDVDAILEMATAWDLAEPFERPAVELLVKNYFGSAQAAIEKYLSELTAAKRKN
jgi:hypothetical protein